MILFCAWFQLDWGSVELLENFLQSVSGLPTTIQSLPEPHTTSSLFKYGSSQTKTGVFLWRMTRSFLGVLRWGLALCSINTCQINKKTVSWYLKAREVTHDLKWIYFLGGLVSKPKRGIYIFWTSPTLTMTKGSQFLECFLTLNMFTE